MKVRFEEINFEVSLKLNDEERVLFSAMGCRDD